MKEVLCGKGLAKKDKDTDTIKPTRAAVMLFAEYPTHLMETKCAIKVMRYRGKIETFGNTPNMVGTQKIIEGPMIKIIKEAQEYVLTLLSGGLEITSGFKTMFKLPERAVKEGITNAVIHRDYHIKRDIEIRMFPDRIEVMSPGLFPFNITVRNIGKERAEGYRNDLVVKTLRSFPDPPNLDQNEGVKAMRNEMYGANLYEPKYTTFPTLKDAVRLTLLNEERPTQWEKVKRYLEEHDFINNEKARKITGVEQRSDMTKLFNLWVRKDLLIKIVPGNSGGGRRWTTYALFPDEFRSPEV